MLLFGLVRRILADAMTTPIRGILVSCLLALACKSEAAAPEPPASVRALDDPCENIVAATLSRTVVPEQDLAVKGLSLWRICPCHRPSCSVVGSDASGALVKSNDVVLRHWDESPQLSAKDLAEHAIHVLGETKSPVGQHAFTAMADRAPSITGRRLTFVTSRPAMNAGFECTRYVVDAARRTVDETDVTSSFGPKCDARAP